MKWHFLFRKKRNKKDSGNTVYSDSKSKVSNESEHKTEIIFETISSSTNSNLPHNQHIRIVRPSKSSREYLHEGELLSGEEFEPNTPDSDISGFSGTLTAREHTKDTSIGTNSNRDETLAFCPHCHTLVHPITKKRARIRTNPWLSSSIAGSGTLNTRKRPRLSDITQKTNLYQQTNSMQNQDHQPITSVSMSDSGIFDPQNTQSDASIGGLHEVAEVQGETEMENQEDWRYAISTENSRPVTLVSEFPVNDESDAENDRSVVHRKKKRRRKRRQLDMAAQSKQELFSPSPEPYLPGPPIIPNSTAVRPSWLGTHLGTHNICQTPYDEVDEDSAMFDQNLEVIWQDDTLTRDSNVDLLDDNLDEEVCQLFPNDNSSTSVEVSHFDPPWPANNPGPNVDPPDVDSASIRSVDEIRIGLKDKIEKLCRDKWELERKFDMVQTFQERQVKEQASLVRDVNDYRKELVLRGLSSAHKQLDSQLDRLQTSYDSLLNMKVKSLYDSSSARGSSLWDQADSPADTTYVEYERL